VPGELRDFIDVYLTEIESTKDPESSFFGEKGIENLVMSLSDLFFAGSETTRLTQLRIFDVENEHIFDYKS